MTKRIKATNGKKLSEQLREKRQKKADELGMIYCPLCKQNKHEGSFIHNQHMNFYVCKDCGVCFMNPKHVVSILDEINKKKNSIIVTP